MGSSTTSSTHYQTLGLDRGCTRQQIRDAYRQLAKRHHPDANPGFADTSARITALNAAYETLSDPARRRAYDRELDAASRSAAGGRPSKPRRNISQEIRLRIEDFIRGTSVKVHVNDPGNPDGMETYRLDVPAGTAPGARLRIPRTGAARAGYVELRVKALPGFRFKPRGSDLRCELRIDARRASHGGTETMEGPAGQYLRIEVPPRVKRGEILRVPNQGLPKPRGGRGDLLVRVTYRPEVRVTRSR
ncbi:MAG TPA: DnaJ domain-containing protein [Chthoniobacterales bacterium]|jgi:DnaJ-class molecular chaperone|nr:DnaJ domain-containing protein [Chthoniobacterales bacterium]